MTTSKISNSGSSKKLLALVAAVACFACAFCFIAPVADVSATGEDTIAITEDGQIETFNASTSTGLIITNENSYSFSVTISNIGGSNSTLTTVTVAGTTILSDANGINASRLTIIYDAESETTYVTGNITVGTDGDLTITSVTLLGNVTVRGSGSLTTTTNTVTIWETSTVTLGGTGTIALNKITNNGTIELDCSATTGTV
ncbi:MAG: hypothetical protein Q4Q62_06980, partial [Thermoplasmata archaeon]|nr:hypothetical protein [Thermoplasmata archaeon]